MLKFRTPSQARRSLELPRQALAAQGLLQVVFLRNSLRLETGNSESLESDEFGVNLLSWVFAVVGVFFIITQLNDSIALSSTFIA